MAASLPLPATMIAPDPGAYRPQIQNQAAYPASIFATAPAAAAFAAAPSAAASVAAAWNVRSFAEVLAVKNSAVPSMIKQPTTFKGEPGFRFTKEEMKTLAVPFSHALVGKFSAGRPNFFALRKAFETIGLKGTFSLGLLDYHHVLIRLSSEEDYTRLFIKGYWQILSFNMKIIKWIPFFRTDVESSMVPVWLSFEHLPVEFHNKEILWSFASLFGVPLKVDLATARLDKPSTARVCVELDVRKQHPKRFYIGDEDTGVWQSVIFENLPDYCLDCSELGHKTGNCNTKNSGGPNHLSRTSQNVPPTRKEWRSKEAGKDLDKASALGGPQTASIAPVASPVDAPVGEHADINSNSEKAKFGPNTKSLGNKADSHSNSMNKTALESIPTRQAELETNSSNKAIMLLDSTKIIAFETNSESVTAKKTELETNVKNKSVVELDATTKAELDLKSKSKLVVDLISNTMTTEPDSSTAILQEIGSVAVLQEPDASTSAGQRGLDKQNECTTIVLFEDASADLGLSMHAPIRYKGYDSDSELDQFEFSPLQREKAWSSLKQFKKEFDQRFGKTKMLADEDEEGESEWTAVFSRNAKRNKRAIARSLISYGKLPTTFQNSP